jgi:hypothetical protein
MLKKIPLEELQFGMYVNELDRPWTDTPFVFQGFFLTTPEQLEVLRRFCKHVYVDPERVAEPERARSPAIPLAASAAPKLVGTGRFSYHTTVTVESEFTQAREIYKSSEESVYSMIEDFREAGTLDATVAAGAARSMSDSIKRNPDALVLFSTLKDREDLIDKALHVSVYMVALARFLEMS